ncbi:MAG: hypothetical protein IJW00_08995, partial [Clostridia bacterium]|nr:hypothetical protein [Clostridia bacterium]
SKQASNTVFGQGTTCLSFSCAHFLTAVNSSLRLGISAYCGEGFFMSLCGMKAPCFERKEGV